MWRRRVLHLLAGVFALGLGGLTVLLVGVAIGDPSGSEVLELHLDTITNAGTGTGTVSSGETPDSSGNDLAAQAQGSLVTGRFGHALDLSDAGDGVTVPDNALLRPATQITVVAWVEHLGNPGDLETVVGKGFGNNNCHSQSYDLSTGYQGGILFNVILSDGSTGTNYYSPEGSPSVPWDGQWHAIAGTYDGNAVSLYEDGQLVGSTTTPQNTLLYGTGDSDLYVGGLPSFGNCDESTAKFNGRIDEVRVYNRALTASEIATLQSPSATTPPELTGGGTTTTGTTTTGTTTTGTTTTGTTTTGTTTTGTTPTPPPGSHNGAWYEIGASASPVNHVADADASQPILAAAEDGTPYLSWNEADTVDGTPVDQARVASLGSSALEPRPWNELLSPTGQPAPNDTDFSLNPDPGQNATHTHVVVSDGTPYAAFIEPDSGGQGQVRVQSWDGTRWTAVGGVASLNLNTADDASDVALADVTESGSAEAGPFVAWTETVNGVTELVAKHWDGSQWSQLGGVISTAGAAASEVQASNAAGVPTLAWVETPQGSSHTALAVAYYSASVNGGGPGWVDEPQPTQTAGTDAHSPSLTSLGGHIVLASSEHTANSDQIIVQERAGTGWTSLTGLGLNHNANGHAIDPTITSTPGDGYLWLAWSERDPGSNNNLLWTASYDFSTSGPWSSSLPPVNHDDNASATDPDLIDAAVPGVGGPAEVPVLAWTETDPNGHQQVRAAAYGVPPTNTALPSISGTPQNGQVLTCSHGSWSAGADGSAQPTRYGEVWERGARTATSGTDPSWTPIPGATQTTYTVQAADDGLRVRCRVVAGYGIVSAQAVTTSLRTDAGPPSLNDLSYPQVLGTPIVNHTLTCDPGPLVSDPAQPGWHNNPDFSYFWLKNGVAIDGATSSTYTPTAYYYGTGGFTLPDGDGDHDISCGVNAENDLGSSTGDSVSVHEYDGPPFIVSGGGAPTITVVPDDPAHPSPLAETLSCSTGQFIEGTGNFGYQWLRSETPIAGATSSTYRVTVQDLGRELSCETTDSNVAGTSQPNESAETLIPIPAATSSGDTVLIHMEGATNQVDPTNLLPVTSRYENAIASYTISKLKNGIAAATATCTTEQAQHNWPALSAKPAVNVPLSTEEDRCRVLLGDPDHVIPEVTGGVRWITGNCNSKAAQEESTDAEGCPDLDIQVAPIDPQKPPALSGDEIAAVGPSSPAEILWDLNGDGRTDAICPGSAPVLSTIFNYDSHFHPRVTIIDQDGTVSSGDISLALGNGEANGELRSSQVRVCQTSLDPPPTANLPCVTSGQIGSLTLSNANLCPISARQIDPADFGTLLPGDLQGYLLAASEGQLTSSGVITDRATRRRRDGGPLTTSYVNWSASTEPSLRVAVRAAHGLHAVDATQAIATGSVPSPTLAATTASALASFSSENSPSRYPVLKLPSSVHTGPASVIGVANATFAGFRFELNTAKAALAYDQIYVARGLGDTTASDSAASAADQAANAVDSIVPGVDGDAGEAMLDGVGLSAAPIAGQASEMLLVGSDVSGALPEVKSFTLTGRNIAATMGLPTDCTSASTCTAVALGEAHGYTAQLADDLSAQGKAAASQVLASATGNLDEMTKDYQDDAKAYGQQLLDRVKNSLDVGPFTFSGDTHVDLNSDGTATLTVSASLPGLTGSGPKTNAQGQPILDDSGNPVPMDGSAISGQATFHADQQGHLALRGVHITAPAAFFLGISLKDVDLTYNSDTGFDLKAQILIAALGNAGIDIKNFQLDPNGKFEDLAVDYLAGAGSGIPVFPGIQLTQLGFDLNTAQSKFSADVGVTVGTSVGAGCVPLGAVGQVTIQLYQPVEVQGVVSPQIFCLPFGNITFDVKGDGTVSLTGNWGLHTSLVDFDIALGAMFGGSDSIAPGAFQIYAHGDGDIIGIIKGELDAVLSDRGVAACGSIDVTVPIIGDLLKIVTGSRTIHIAAGASEDFRNGIPLTAPQILAGLHVFTGCDIGRYYPLGEPNVTASSRTGAAPANAGGQSFRLPAGRGPTIISFTGAGHAPRFTLVSPSGQSYDVTSTGTYGSRLAHGAWGSIVDPDAKTVVILPKPTGGVWTVRPAPGSAQILNVSAAPILPPAAIKGHVSGRGAMRTLHYTVVREPGQTMRISEQADGENHQIGQIGASAQETLVRGAIHYRVGEASAARRQIIAQVFQNGAPRTELMLARYRAVNPTVAPVTELRVHRSGHRARITWRPGPLDRTYYVRVVYGDGRKILDVTRRPSLLSAEITRTEGLQVRVYATSASGRPSHFADTTLPGSMLVGSVHPLGPVKAPKFGPNRPRPLHPTKAARPTRFPHPTKPKRHRR